MRIPNRYAAAFKENGNLIGLASATALSLAMLNPIPLLAAIAAEAAYMVFVPDTKWFAQRLEKKYDEEIRERREQLKREILPKVRPSIQERFERLESKRAQIETQSQGEDKWFREALRKLDYLLEKFLEFAEREEWFGKYLKSLTSDVNQEPPELPPSFERRRTRHNDNRIDDPEEAVIKAIPFEVSKDWIDGTVADIQSGYQREIDGIQKHLAADPDFPTQRLEEKRVEILTRRRDYVARIGMILHNLGGQMRLIQDTFGLINDEIRARSPEQVLADIDEVVMASNSLAEAIDSVATLDELVNKLT